MVLRYTTPRGVLAFDGEPDAGELTGNADLLFFMQQMDQRFHTDHGIVHGEELTDVSIRWVELTLNMAGVEFEREVVEGAEPPPMLAPVSGRVY